jgi:hypothetical protein
MVIVYRKRRAMSFIGSEQIVYDYYGVSVLENASDYDYGYLGILSVWLVPGTIENI